MDSDDIIALAGAAEPNDDQTQNILNLVDPSQLLDPHGTAHMRYMSDA